MAIDLEAARRQRERCDHLYDQENPTPDSVESRLILERPTHVSPIETPTSKTRVERPYLPKNRRCKRFAIR